MKTSIKHDILTRKDVLLLVSTFYEKIKKEETLGPIFNQMISNWDKHIDRLTDFWESNLLFVATYKGNPIAVHQKVDKTFNETINEKHFGIWLNLWIETLNQLYKGENAELAKRRARKMSTHIFIKMYESRTAEKTVCPFLTEKSKDAF